MYRIRSRLTSRNAQCINDATFSPVPVWGSSPWALLSQRSQNHSLWKWWGEISHQVPESPASPPLLTFPWPECEITLIIHSTTYEKYFICELFIPNSSFGRLVQRYVKNQSALFLYLLPCWHAAGEGDFGNHWVVAEQATGFRSALHHTEEPVRDPCLFVDLSKYHSRHRGHWRGFKHHGIT